MNLYISSDMEGTAGICTWSETEQGDHGYEHFAAQMTKEAAAACEGALLGGIKQVMVKDAHDSGCNINPEALPMGVSMMRSWEKGLECMMAGIDRGFDAAAMTGYHSAGGTNGSPLAHTMSRENHWIRMNGRLCSEFEINAYIAAYYKVPVIFVSGDRALCETAQELIPGITAVPVCEGFGGASISMHPAAAVELIREEMKKAVQRTAHCHLTLPEQFDVEIEFLDHGKARHGSFYPGASAVGAKGVEYHIADYYEVLRFFSFVL